MNSRNKSITLVTLLLITLDMNAKSICKNPDVLIKTKNGYRFACSKILYAKKQAQEINSKLYRVQTMPIILRDRKLYVKFNHYKTLSLTQVLNEEQYTKLTQLIKPEVD